MKGIQTAWCTGAGILKGWCAESSLALIFHLAERFFIIKCQKTKRSSTCVSQCMPLISCILDSSVTHPTVTYPFLPRTLGQYIGIFIHSPQCYRRFKNVQHIVQAPRETAVCTTDRWPSCAAFIFRKKQMLFKQLCKGLFHYNSEMLQKRDGEPNLAWRYWRGCAEKFLWRRNIWAKHPRMNESLQVAGGKNRKRRGNWEDEKF